MDWKINILVLSVGRVALIPQPPIRVYFFELSICTHKLKHFIDIYLQFNRSGSFSLLVMRNALGGCKEKR